MIILNIQYDIHMISLNIDGDNIILKNKKKNVLFSASEIGQFNYCSVSWILKKKGYHSGKAKKKSHGMRIHDRIGKRTHRFFWLIRLSYLFMIFGSIIMIIAFFISYYFVGW